MSCLELLECIINTVSIDRHYENSWYSQQITSLTSQTMADLQINYPDIYYSLLNIVIKQESCHLMFIPCGIKSSKSMLKKYTDVNHILSEVSVAYNKNYIHNLNLQFPGVLDKFNFTDKIAKFQRKIFGYFVMCKTTPKERYAEISHAFTNTKTIEYLQQSRSLNFKMLDEAIDNVCSYKMCLSGEIVGHLTGKKSGNTTYEILTCDEDKQLLWNTTLLEENCSPFSDLSTLINCKKILSVPCKGGKIKWGKETILVPRQTIDLTQSPIHCVKMPIDLLNKESLLVYYKGVKFLCISHKNTSILASSPPNTTFIESKKIPVISYRCDSPILPEEDKTVKQPSWKTKITRVFQNSSFPVKIYPNCFLTENSSEISSLWVLRQNGSFDLVAGVTYFLPWICTKPYVSFGTISKTNETLTIIYIGSSSNIAYTKYCLTHNINQKATIRVNFATSSPAKKKKYPSGIKKISTIIQDDKRQKRNSVSILSTLLQRNER